MNEYIYDKNRASEGHVNYDHLVDNKFFNPLRRFFFVRPQYAKFNEY